MILKNDMRLMMSCHIDASLAAFDVLMEVEVEEQAESVTKRMLLMCHDVYE